MSTDIAQTNTHVGRRTIDKLLSRKQAADYLGVAPQTLATWNSKKLRGSDKQYPTCIKVGKLAKYWQSDLDAFLSSGTVPA